MRTREEGLKLDQKYYEVILKSDNLSLVPLTGADARDLFPVLNDARLHRFIGDAPVASEEHLRERYESLESRHSPDGSELWLNWVLRKRIGNAAVGTVQATVRGDVAEVAWVVGTTWQGKGYAKEAVSALVSWLFGIGVETTVAHVHPQHVASARVAAAAGLEQTGDIVDDEIVWRLSR